MKTLLYIDGCLADTDDETVVAISLSVSSLTDLEGSRTGYTKSLSVPMTAHNMTLMGDCQQIHARDMFNAAQHTARVEAGGATVIEGQLLLTRCEAGRDGGGRYVLSILGAASLWASHAASTALSHTAIPFDWTISASGVKDGWSSNAIVKFLPVQRGEYERRNSSVSLRMPARVLSFSDLHPFIALRPLLDAIFAESGYSIVSNFMDSPLFRSLHISGNYPEKDTQLQRSRYDFRAGRFADAEAAADYRGRVYATPYRSSCTVGNIVDTADPAGQQDGATAEGVYSNGGCFRQEGEAVCFVPGSEVSAGFEYSLRYVTDYTIASRTRLRGFDTFYAGIGRKYDFEIANRFPDLRSRFEAGFSYRAVVFDHVEGTCYELRLPRESGVTALLASFDTRSHLFTAPASMQAAEEPQLFVVGAGGVRQQYEGDWALYNGYVGECGQTEVEATFTTPPERITPTSPKYFYDIWFGGAEEGMTLRLLKETRVRPVFAANPCEGSKVDFRSVASLGVSQLALVNAVKQMFNLRFYTDTAARKVFVEPFDDFFDRTNVVDWSDRLDMGGGVVVEEPGEDLARVLTLRYRDGDSAVTEFERQTGTPYGSWSTVIDNRRAAAGELSIVNRLFAPSVVKSGVIPGAEGAGLLAVEESAGDSLNIRPRVAIYAGLQPLPEGQSWSWPEAAESYPQLLFHDPEGGRSLCFEDRDGCTGLHGRYDTMLRMINQGRRVTFRLHLTPQDVEPLICLNTARRDFRAVYRIDYQGEEGYYVLEEICDYNPSGGATKCIFNKLI